MKCTDCPYYYKTDGERYPSCQFGEPSWLDVPPCEQEDIDRQRDLDEQEHEEMLREWRDEAIAETALEILRHYSIGYDLAREYATDAYDNDVDVRDILRSIRDELRPERLG